MPSYGEARSIEIHAPRELCFAALADADRIKEWQRAVCAVRIFERDAAGRALVVEYEVDARVRRVRYRLRQRYDPPRAIHSEYLEGDFRDFSGEWRFLEPAAHRTRAELALAIDPGSFVPGVLRRLVADAVMGRALRDLKRYVEGPSGSALDERLKAAQ